MRFEEHIDLGRGFFRATWGGPGDAGFVVEAGSDVLTSDEDDHSQAVFADEVRGKTDRFVLRLPPEMQARTGKPLPAPVRIGRVYIGGEERDEEALGHAGLADDDPPDLLAYGRIAVGELPGPFLEEPGQTEQVLRALGTGEVPPPGLVRRAGGGDGPFEAPNWDTDQLAIARQALSELGKLGFDTTYAFGTKEEVRPVDHLVAAGAGWGGLPRTAAFYIMASVEKNDGKTPHAVTVKDVPVDAFWSITVYNADGYLEKNEIGRNSLNNSSATPNEDGSFTIHFGGDPKSVNYLPITEGWNYAIRMYQPRKEILDGSWTFPKIEPVK